MPRYTLGIDTGGTYTDAVIVDSNEQQIIASAKALTSKGDLSIGVGAALESVLSDAGNKVKRSEISHVSLSTTLATNALVEGHGSSMAVFLIGFDDGMAVRTEIEQVLPGARLLRIAGGHGYNGQEQVALDTRAIEVALAGDAGRADSYAVAAHYAVRNPTHEHRAAELIRQKTGRPVTVSSDLSDALDGPRRALTATCNAGIISLIVALEKAVRDSMQRLGITAPLMIVRGDGSIAAAETVVARPIETILSGPAASVIGARFLAGKQDFVIADIGGTTSDVASVRDGWPRLNERGANIGGFRTLVRAIDMHTVGLGGDSEVEVDVSGTVSLREHRVVPVSQLVQRWPRVLDALKSALGETGGMHGATRYIVFPEGATGENFPADLTAADKKFLARLDSQNPNLYNAVVYGAGDRARIPRLVDRGLIQISGVTPSDAAHVLGLQSQWSSEGAGLACELLARASGKVEGREPASSVRRFAGEIHAAVVAKSTHLLIEQLGQQSFTRDNPLIASVTDGQHSVGDLRVALTPVLDIIAVGGPAEVFYPAVGERLGCNVLIPTGSEVANAIGAAVGSVRVSAIVEITRGESGGYWIHHESEPQFCEAASQAIQRARVLARDAAQSRAKKMGEPNTAIEVSEKRIDIPGMGEETSLVAATICAQAQSLSEH